MSDPQKAKPFLEFDHPKSDKRPTIENETLLEFTNRIFDFHISKELDEERNSFCPSKGRCLCLPRCPIHRKYNALSCNQALDKYPAECARLINEYKKERDFNER